ncbi:response regulator [Schaedlerella arabinosiphila]|jgi:DNA-binding response OmpR family regulator|uniref:Stage 0 sporulation protein A homolog n=1 Tax=Schaedlerella arabinosiphila TaxID=2044587 RepID=A0A426DN39_9FIRM|nr:response regulator [Schaedlerella arabinosiphila]MCI9603022.1 response regulator [Ruminococcus sp.]MCI9633202.1 response regulator [Ruminococcus sp.]RRK34138.1 response regulator [Schaedlerella arabinosiphila]
MNRVLIIEDETATAEAVKEALALDDISADIASDGESGLEKLKSNNYDLILLDLKMPGLSGDEVLSEIRKQDPFIDVIIYTNYTEFADIKKLANIGIDGYINKGPKADLAELISAIKEKIAPLNDETISALLKDIPNAEE